MAEVKAKSRKNSKAHKSASIAIIPNYENPIFDANFSKWQRIAKMVMIVEKQWGHCYIVVLSRAFQMWRFRDFNEASSEQVEDMRQSKYLTLYTQHDKLQDQFDNLCKSTIERELSNRSFTGITVIGAVMKSRLRSKIRRAFIVWQNNCRHIKKVLHLNQQLTKLEVGLQHVTSEQHNMVKTEETNNKLGLTLMITLFFYKWKAATTSAAIAQERKLNESQRQQIIHELSLLKKAAALSNQRETSLLTAAQSKGAQTIAALHALKSHVCDILQDPNVKPPVATYHMSQQSIMTGGAAAVVHQAMAEDTCEHLFAGLSDHLLIQSKSSSRRSSTQ